MSHVFIHSFVYWVESHAQPVETWHTDYDTFIIGRQNAFIFSLALHKISWCHIWCIHVPLVADGASDSAPHGGLSSWKAKASKLIWTLLGAASGRSNIQQTVLRMHDVCASRGVWQPRTVTCDQIHKSMTSYRRPPTQMPSISEVRPESFSDSEYELLKLNVFARCILYFNGIKKYRACILLEPSSVI